MSPIPNVNFSNNIEIHEDIIVKTLISELVNKFRPFREIKSVLAKEHSKSNSLTSKEIEYWQITSKEGVKFRLKLSSLIVQRLS